MGRSERWSSNQKPSKRGKQPGVTVTNPYLRGTSKAIKRILATLDIRTQFRPTTTLRKLLVHVEDPVPTEMRTGVVYQSGCQDCPSHQCGTNRETTC